jgi:hypothetical protein
MKFFRDQLFIKPPIVTHGLGYWLVFQWLPIAFGLFLCRGNPLRSGGIVGHFDQQPARSSNSFSGADTGLHLIEFDDFNASGSANGFNGLAIGLDSVIDRHMAAVQNAANGAKTQAFKVKLGACRLTAGLIPRQLTVCL